MVGAEIASEQVDVPAEKPTDTLEVCKLLKAKVVAEGEAELLPAPGKVIIIFPLTGMVEVVVNTMVCLAVMAVLIISPVWCGFVAVLVK
jgi:hypothetical protein